MPRWLCIDPGSKRIGVAVGDTSGGIATPVETLSPEPFEQLARRLGELAGEYDAAGLVVGWPLNMNDSEGPEGRKARELASRLAAETHLDVRMWDERLSSFAADEALAGHLTRGKRRARQDAIAAAEILQDFLSSGGPDAAPEPDDATD